MENYLNKKIMYSFILLCLILFVIGSFSDYSISKTLVNQNSLFGWLCYGFGELPFYCMGLFMGLAYSYDSKKNSIEYYLGRIFTFLGIATISIEPIINNGVYGLYGIVILCFYLKWANKTLKMMDKEMIRKIRKFILWMVIIDLSLRWLKILFFRPRMRLILKSEMVEFRNWYIINNDYRQLFKTLSVAKDDFKSFPSGHGAAATFMMMLTFIPGLYNKRKYKDLLLLTGICFALMISLSRIIYAAHFLTDVSFGMLKSALIILGCYKKTME